MKKHDIAIIGAGPAGIMAAIAASRNGKSVVLIDKNVNVGRKIFATGNGRCNITNRLAESSRYHGGDENFINQVLKNFDQFEAMKFFEKLGIILKEEDKGRIFPRTNQASSVVEALTHELERLHVQVKTECEVKNVVYTDSWEIKLTSDEVIRASKLIMSTGGKAAHMFGSSGDGIYFASKLGHSATDIFAALVPIETEETWVKDIQGLKVEGIAKILVDEKLITERRGDILFTHYGLSGPTVMGLARSAGPYLHKQKVTMAIDCIPEETTESINHKLAEIFANNGAKALKNALAGVVPTNLGIMILKLTKLDPDKKAAQLSRDDRLRLVYTMKNLTLTIKNVRPLKEAQVTAGGIDVSEIDPATMGSRKLDNLFFAGEIVDVDGDSGGFNLQWAWSSGYTAGNGASK